MKGRVCDTMQLQWKWGSWSVGLPVKDLFVVNGMN